MDKKKVYGYVRVSTSDQENSLEVQSKRIKEYCEFKHLQLEKIFVDENISGYTYLSERPNGSKMISMLNSDVRAVVSIKPDRLFRNTVDAISTVENWDSMGIELHLIDIGGATLATKTATGKMIFTILIGFSQFERDLTSERTKAVLSNKKSTGKAYCGAILGFDNIDGKMVVNEKEIQIIKYVKDFNQFGRSCAAIAEQLNIDGFKSKKGGKFYASTIHNILNNPIYDNING